MIPRPLQWHSQSFAIEPGAAITESNPVCCEQLGGFRVDLVFYGEHPCRKVCCRIAWHDRYPALDECRAAVQFLSDEVHGGTVPGVAGFDDAFVGVQAGIGR